MPTRENRKRPARFTDNDEEDEQQRTGVRGETFGMGASAVREDNTSYDNNEFAEDSQEGDPDDYDGYNNEDSNEDTTRSGTQSTPLRANTDQPPPPPRAPVLPQPVNTIGIAAAIKRTFPHGVPRETIVAELEWQGSIKGDAPAIKAFRTSLLVQQGLIVMGFLQPEDTTISLLHSPATYAVRGDTGSMVGKDIGFVGDRAPFLTPIPIILQKEKPWKWVQLEGDFNEVAHQYFYANTNNLNKFYVPPPTAKLSKLKVPRIILLPTNLIEYCTTSPRTPWDLLNHIKQLFLAEPGPAYAEYDLIISWCLAASHGTADGSSVLSYSLEAAHSSAQSYQHWIRLRLDSTLGPVSAAPPQLGFPPTPPTQTDTATLAAVAAEFGKGVLQAINPAGGTAVATALGTAAAAVDGKVYDAYHYAVIQGFSNCPTRAGLQPIWGLFTQTKTIETHRLHLRKYMNQWAQRYSVNIHKGLFLSKLTIEAIVHLRFNPSGGVAYFNSAEKGISILTCQPMPGEEKDSARNLEVAEEISSANLTLAEALDLGKSDPRPPPATYQDLKATVGTFCALLHTLFGPGCDYYQKCFELYACLDSDRASENCAKFTPLMCRQIIWAILDDGREYFNHPMLPDDFAVPLGAPIKYPVSELEEFFRPIKNITPILQGSFPSQWMPKQERQDTRARQGNTTNTNSGLVVPQSIGGGSGPASIAGSQATGASSLTGTTQRPATVRQTNIHTKIKSTMGPFIARIGRLQISRIMALSGVTWNEMPTLPAYMEGTTNKLCYNFVMGKCNPRYCTHRAGHAPSTDVTDDFADTLCTLLSTGMADMTPDLARISWPEFQAIIASRTRTRE